MIMSETTFKTQVQENDKNTVKEQRLLILKR
jgi:hypothetical protein